MKKVFTVNDCGDPYEPAFILAVCSSVEKCKELFPTGIWYDNEEKKDEHNRSISYTNSITGEKKDCDNMGWPPTPFIEEVELDTIINK